MFFLNIAHQYVAFVLHIDNSWHCFILQLNNHKVTVPTIHNKKDESNPLSNFISPGLAESVPGLVLIKHAMFPADNVGN